MRESIFSKIYSYRERENKHSKENFIIEIFAHCLQTDRKFLSAFADLLGLTVDSETTIRTQTIYEYGRPDIEINIPSVKVCVLVECKIEHFERPNQLEDYKKILESKKVSGRHLVYLTKYYDCRENNNRKIKLHLLKWFDVFQLIDEQNSILSQELKSYIIDENMSESQNFSYSDLLALKNISGTIRKMDEVLDAVQTYYEERIGKLSRDSARSTRMKDEWYSMYQVFNRAPNYRFDTNFGFIWWWNNEIYLGARIYIPISDKYNQSGDYVKFFKKNLKGWEVEEYDSVITIGDYKPVAQFIIDEEEQIPAMVSYLKGCIDKLEGLKRVDPKIFK